MRRKDREMNREFAMSVASTCEYANMAMVAADGMPYIVPLSIAVAEDVVYWHSAQDGKKINVLRDNPRVCISCIGYTRRSEDDFTTEFESAIIFGKASEVTDETVKIKALRLICERHTPKNMAEFDNAIAKSLARTAVWQVTIDEVTGKRKKFDAAGKEMKFGRME